MYNLKNEDDFYYIHQLIISNKLIPFYNQFIHAPTVDELLQMKPNEYNKLIFPFSLSLDCFTDKKDANILDCIYLSCINEINNNKPCLVDDLINGISFFLKIDKSMVNPVVMGNNIEIHIGRDIVNGFYLNGEKFNELASIIRVICNLKQLHKEDFENVSMDKDDIEEQKMLKSATNEADKERIRRFYKNLKEAKKRRNKYKKKSKSEKAVNLYNTFSFVSNKWESFDKVTKLNIYQLFDVYNFLNADINFHFDMGVACSGWADKNFRIRDIRLETVK